MNRPRLLDLYCGQGGAAMGYHRAGFEVVGVDINPQPKYPFEFVQADALAYLADRGREFDAIHASPPCQDHSSLNNVNGIDHGTAHLLADTRELLGHIGSPWVIENVPGAPMTDFLMLCGTELGLFVDTEQFGRVWLRRHRWFESSHLLMGAGGCHCHGKTTIGVYGNGGRGANATVRGPGVAAWSRTVMGIDWMTRHGLDQAIPPAYTKHIGEQLIAYIEAVQAA